MRQVTYLFTAFHPSGYKVTDRVAASSAADAISILQSRGFTEVRLLEDDSFIAETRQPGHHTEKTMSPATAARLQTAGASGAMLLTIFNAYKQLGVLTLVLTAYFVYRRVKGAPWSYADYGWIALILVPGIFAATLSWLTGVYWRVQELSYDGRWAEIESLMPRLEKVLRKIGPKGLLETAVWKAKILIEKGQIEQAIAEVEQLHRVAGLTEADVQMALGRAHSCIPDFPAMIQCHHRMIEFAPENPMGSIGLAEVYAVHLRKPQEARAALERVRGLGLSELTRNARQLTEAAIAVGEGRAHEARSMIESTLPFFERMIQANPTTRGFVHVYESLLAEACAMCGDRDAAERYLARCRNYLTRVRIPHLVQRAEAALANGVS